MMKAKFNFWLLLIFFHATISSLAAQQPAKVPRIGYLTGSSAPTSTTPDTNADAFNEGLRNLGYIEGKNIRIEYRYADGKSERHPSHVTELLQMKADVLVAIPFPAVLAAKQATKIVPIVMVTNDDPVATGLVQSLGRPGGNLTGITRYTRELSGKRLELFKEMVPTLSRVGILAQAGSRPGQPSPISTYEDAARHLKISLYSLEVRSPNPDLKGVFREMVNNRIEALITARHSILVIHRKQIADLAIKNRLPLMSEGKDFADSGSLVSYASDDVANFRRAAYYVDRILKGAKPADLPVEQPMKFEFVINLKTAKQIGVIIPQSVLYRADKVIR
jgi:putative ABC transport system substrate-binding protein